MKKNRILAQNNSDDRPTPRLMSRSDGIKTESDLLNHIEYLTENAEKYTKNCLICRVLTLLYYQCLSIVKSRSSLPEPWFPDRSVPYIGHWVRIRAHILGSSNLLVKISFCSFSLTNHHYHNCHRYINSGASRLHSPRPHQQTHLPSRVTSVREECLARDPSALRAQESDYWGDVGDFGETAF